MLTDKAPLTQTPSSQIDEDKSKIVTVAIPTKNRVTVIDRILSSIYSQNYIKKQIKIVFLDESDDGTYQRLSDWKKKVESEYFSIELLTLETKGYISKARNICVSRLAGDIIFFWDSDVIASGPNALGNVLSMLTGSTAIAGFPYFTENPSLYEQILQSETIFGGMGFTAVKKEVFERIGLFNENLKMNEDTDLMTRARRIGLGIKFDGSSPCLHLKPKRNIGFKTVYYEYIQRVRWCYFNQPFLHRELIKEGSKGHLFRLIYYFALPVLLVLWLLTFIFPFIPAVIATIFIVAYLGVNLVYHVVRSGRNRFMGLVAFLYYTPCGVAVSYGYLASLFTGFKP